MAGDYDLEELYANTFTEEDRQALENQPVSPKKFVVAWLFALLLGPLGAHRYYLGHVPTAVVKTVLLASAVTLFSLGQENVALGAVALVGAWTVIDLVLLLTGTMRDSHGHQLANYRRRAGVCAAITVLLLATALTAALIIGTSTAVAGQGLGPTEMWP